MSVLLLFLVALFTGVNVDSFLCRDGSAISRLYLHRQASALFSTPDYSSSAPSAPESTVMEASILPKLETMAMSESSAPPLTEGMAAAAIEALVAVPVAPRELTPISALQVIKKEAKPIIHPEGSGYIMCSSCKSAFVVSESDLGRRGMRVRCGVCDKEWYQSGERLLQSDSQNVLMNMTDAKVVDIRKAISERNWPKYPRVDKIGIFVGNLPYDYSEKEIGDLFGEYGITGISLVRDPTGLSKGFAFLELSNEKDVELMIKEMHLFHVDAQRKLTVRIVRYHHFLHDPIKPLDSFFKLLLLSGLPFTSSRIITGFKRSKGDAP